MKVKDFMITDVVSITKDQSIRQLLELLVKHRIGGVPVVDENNYLDSMISDGDVIRYLQPKGRTVYDMYMVFLVNERENFSQKLHYSTEHKVEKIMRRSPLYTVHPEDQVEAAFAIISKHHFKKIPVVNDENKVVGVVSRGDLIRFISTKLLADKGE
ncbi:CBS domain-containing protein [Virgibacillus kekensis]|uniref:CBS domain-containing protein n=1 Tax=Virgibacillus kekensis TaxID=202261 RepID=A0ABV9DEX7_9BACI